MPAQFLFDVQILVDNQFFCGKQCSRRHNITVGRSGDPFGDIVRVLIVITQRDHSVGVIHRDRRSLQHPVAVIILDGYTLRCGFPILPVQIALFHIGDIGIKGQPGPKTQDPGKLPVQVMLHGIFHTKGHHDQQRRSRDTDDPHDRTRFAPCHIP